MLFSPGENFSLTSNLQLSNYLTNIRTVSNNSYSIISHEAVCTYQYPAGQEPLTAPHLMLLVRSFMSRI